jgi:hypothetical protein
MKRLKSQILHLIQLTKTFLLKTMGLVENKLATFHQKVKGLDSIFFSILPKRITV